MYLKDLGGEPSLGYLQFSTNLWHMAQNFRLDLWYIYCTMKIRMTILCRRLVPVSSIPFIDRINLPLLRHLQKKTSSIDETVVSALRLCKLREKIKSSSGLWVSGP
jgi:hypothetical protein